MSVCAILDLMNFAMETLFTIILHIIWSMSPPPPPPPPAPRPPPPPPPRYLFHFEALRYSSYWRVAFKLGFSFCKAKGLFASLQPFENDRKRFLFYLKSSFRSQDI